MEFVCPFCKKHLPYVPDEVSPYCMLCGVKVFEGEDISSHNNSKTSPPHDE